MFIAIDGGLAGLVAVADRIKATTAQAIRALHESGLRIIMATGDSERTAKAVAESLGIDEVRADVLPEGKKALIDELHAKGAPWPWPATASTTLPRWRPRTSGSPWERVLMWPLESAGITLVKGDLNGIVRARRLARSDHGQHPAEPVLRLRLQRARRSGGGGRALPDLRLAAFADDRGSGNEPFVGFGDRQCAEAAISKALKG